MILIVDAAMLRKNVINHIESIVDEVDLEDIKGEIISRYGLHGDVVEDQIIKILESQKIKKRIWKQ
jgi:hypothetical protein